MQNWWKNKQALEQVVSWAFELDEQYPTERLISLGQSPAWIVQGAGMIRKLRQESANTSFIPFTGSYVEKDPTYKSEDQGKISFTKQNAVFPKQDRLVNYFNFLEKLGLEPNQVLEQANDSGQDAVLVEMIKAGNGLASFLSVWLRSPEGDEAIKALGDKIKIHVYDTNPSLKRDKITFSCKSHVEVPLNNRHLSQHEAELMQNTSAHNVAEDNSDRLVGMYRLAANKEDVGLECSNNAPVVKEILQAMHVEIQRRFQSEQPALTRSYDPS